MAASSAPEVDPEPVQGDAQILPDHGYGLPISCAFTFPDALHSLGSNFACLQCVPAPGTCQGGYPAKRM